ncbi:MAG TPA: ABC transporter permease, partial [Emcibacteraceae bacterium]|nr:ABC transporter permease [Emcibacteraceae bacterium]
MLLANYVTSAWRNILRHKLFSIINIMGLAIGLAAVMLIALYVRYETSYDSFWKNADNIYRMQMTISMPGRDPVDALFAPLMAAPSLKQDFSEIIHVARAFPHSASFIQKNNRSRESVKFVDPEILEIFQFDVLAGDIKASLNDNRSLVLNETLSKKYFGDLAPIGKTITLDLGTFKKDYKVGAVIKNKRENSHVEFSAMLGLFESDWANDPIMFKSWLRPYAHTFFTVKSGTNIDIFNEQMGDFIDRHYPAPMSGDTNKKPSEEVSFSALNIQDVHLNASGFGDDTPSGDYTTILVFSLVAALILLIAIFNFMNLTTARATQRAKEISLRKVMGAARKHLIVQFISESILLTFLALLISLVFVETSLPLLNEMIGKSLILDYLGLDAVMIFILTALVGIFAGFYPAFILSSFRPTENLKSNKSSETRGSVSIRNSLVIIQFTVSVFLFVTTAIIYFQIRFTENFDYGFDKENTLT